MGTEKNVDQALVERVQKGDSRAFDLLVLKYQNRISKLIARFVRNQADVQDVAQEAFIKAYRALPNFRGESAFYTWLSGLRSIPQRITWLRWGERTRPMR